MAGTAATTRTEVPPWAEGALSAHAEERVVEVEGCAIATRAWGDPEDPGLVLVHGGAAHARWWDHVAPLFAADRRVVALDLSGHGDSGRREAYPPATWAREVVAVVEAHGLRRPAVVGHSMGGFVSILVAAMIGDRLSGTVVVDSPVRRPDPERVEARRGRMFAAPKTYPSREAAVGHFVLVPPQPCEERWLLDHVAHHSLREVEDGWTWKFDPAVFGRFDTRDPVFGDHLEQALGPIAVLHGALSSIVDRDVTDWMAQRLGRPAPFIEIPGAHHHLILDQPLAFVTAVRTLLATWA